MDQPPRERVTCRPSGQLRCGELTLRGGQHQVAEPAATQHGRVGDQAGVPEDGAHRRRPCARVRERGAIADVGAVDTRRAQRTGHGGRELCRRQVRRSARPREQVRYHHIEGSGRDLFQNGAGVCDPDAHPASPPPARPASTLGKRQPPPDQLHQRRVRLDRQLVGARPGHCHITGQGQAAASEVQHAQRLSGWCRQIDEVPQAPHVLELQVPRVVEVDV